jgi:ubiquinone/menaquinone biosynthesis C-methylase UbiE
MIGRSIGPAERLAYAAAQAARVSFFVGQSALAARMTGPAVPKAERPPGLRTPDRETLLAELRALFRQDLANIEAGYYRMPRDLVIPPREAVEGTLRFFRDLPRVVRRRREKTNAEPFRAPPPGTPKLPRYYLQNFHYQTDGWLTADSARLYDHQVEVLFGGGADAMRRQALVPIHVHLKGRRIADCRLLDVATGTGRFLGAVKDNWPALQAAALDLSVPYLREARRRLRPRRGVAFVQGAAEALPFPDASQDVVTCVYLFHELPRKVRARAAAEMARVTRPGGIVVVADSLQFGDRPTLDGLLELFPLGFHEPYFADYARADIPALFAPHGMEAVGTSLAYLTKVMVFRKV